MWKYFNLLITNNTGVSLKAFMALSGMILASLMVLTIITTLIVDLFTNYKVDTDLYGIAAVIGAIAGFIVASVYGKLKGEEIDKNNNQEIKE